jgi:hypothetical protein
VKTIVPTPLGELAELMQLTSTIQDAKRAAIQGKPYRWPDHMEREFAQLEARAKESPYVALDLEYLRDPSPANRSFAYVVTYDTFISPPRDPAGAPVGAPELVSVVKLGDGGRAEGRGAGAASGSIVSRTVRSYWDEPNTYRGVLQGVVGGSEHHVPVGVDDAPRDRTKILLLIHPFSLPPVRTTGRQAGRPSPVAPAASFVLMRLRCDPSACIT